MLARSRPSLVACLCYVKPEQVTDLVYIHTNLRLVDRIRSVGYAVDSLKWTTDNAEETDSQSDSCSDSE